MIPELVLIKGAGDLATGVAHRLFRAGINVVLTEREKPTVVRRPVSFAQAVFDGEAEIEGVVARRVESLEEVGRSIAAGQIPLLVDPSLRCLAPLQPDVLVEATVSKRNTGVTLGSAPIVVALGPGYWAGRDVHAVVETARGHYLGRVIYRGAALPNTGVPGDTAGFTVQRVLRAPSSGSFYPCREIGDLVNAGDTVAYVDNYPVKAQISGVIRGLLHRGLEVSEGMKVGDIDPRAKREYCFTISDKARAVGGGVLEAVLYLSRPERVE